MSVSKQDILNAYHFRHACKAYDPNKKVSEEDMRFILETARLSPSSFGFEPWKFLVVENQSVRELLRDNAWGIKDKIMDCSYAVILLARQQNTLLADSGYPEYMMRDVHHLPEDVIGVRKGFYRNFTEQDFALANEPRAFFDWACRQTYIALGNMLTTAAMLGIDSTPIEGFPLEKLNQVLADKGLFDPTIYKISVMATFGYRLNEPKAKTRQAFDEVVEWIR